MADWPNGYGLHVLDEVDSTLDEANRLAPTLRGPVWILARRQTAGRGRRGRSWENAEGNLAATLVMGEAGDAARAALRSFVASLAVFDACVAVTGRADGLALKWPNDVLLNGGKLAGILLESTGQGGEISHLAIGIGVNLSSAPDETSVEARALRPVALAAETGVLVTPEDFLGELASAFDRRETQFVTYGFEPIRKAWLSRAARLGQPVTARTATSETTGTFETVDETGNLVLLTPRGRVCIPAADVYF